MSTNFSCLVPRVHKHRQNGGMHKEFSIYLDLVRFVAAFMVLLYHANIRELITHPVPFSGHGHTAVIVFFVLSGYVISYITAEREGAPLSYWSSRLSRFYLLVIPVVLVNPLLDLVGESLAPQFYVSKTTHDLAWFRILTSLTYLNEIWHISIMSFSNVPFWSLCYEMWYYVMFAVVCFMRGRPRMYLLAACMLVVGPKILLLAPVWILGVVLYKWQALKRMPEALSWGLFGGSIILYSLFQHYGINEYGEALLHDLIGAERTRQLTFSRYFIGDYPLALIVAANFVGFRNIAPRFGWILLPLERPIRWLAALTFPLYVMHQPLLQFFAALINGDPATPMFYSQVIACILVTVAVCGTYSEKKRQAFKRWMQTGLQGLKTRLSGYVIGRPML